MMITLELAAKASNDEARGVSDGIAGWIDAQRKAGSTEIAIFEVLKATTELVAANKKLKLKTHAAA